MLRDAEIKVSELFSTRQAAQLLGRTHFCVYWHAVHNLDGAIMLSTTPIGTTRPCPCGDPRHPHQGSWIGGRLYFTKDMLRKLVREHLRLKPGENRDEILRRVENAVSEI